MPAPANPGTRSASGKSGSAVKTEPAQHLIQHIKQDDPMLFEYLTRLGKIVNDAINYGTTIISAITNNTTNEIYKIILVIKDTTVGNSIADLSVVHGGGTTYKALIVASALHKAITSDLTVRLNLTFKGTTSIVGTFVIPLATVAGGIIIFNSFVTSILPELGVISFDITTSDGSSDSTGVASFALWYQ